jgi:hypothetical protein
MNKKELRAQVLQLEEDARHPRREEEVRACLEQARNELNEWRAIGHYMPGIRTTEWCASREQAYATAKEMQDAWPGHVVIIDPTGKSTWV